MNENKIKSVLNLFNHGQSVSNPTAWKNGQITINAIAGFIWAISGVTNAYGYELPINLDQDIVNGASIAILSIANWVFTIVSSDKVGFNKK